MSAAMRTFLRHQFKLASKDNVPITRSQWFTLPHMMNVYLRAGRIYNRELRQFYTGVVVSNIEIEVTLLRGQGYFRMFNKNLEEFAKKLGYETISYESVGSDRLELILEKHGYTREEVEPWPNYYKFLNPVAKKEAA